MRTFEILLLIVNALSLLLTIKKQPKALWLGAAGANLALLLIHGFVEGLRYQLAFAYLFVLLLTLMALAKLHPRIAAARTPLALKIPALILALLSLGLSAFLAYALPVFSLPQPTGPYAVGIHYLHLVDEKRADPFLDKTPRPRELMVKIYYPAQPDDSKPYASYFHHSPELVRLLSAGYNMPEFMFDQLNLVKTHSKDDMALADARPSYPVVLFSHGAGTSMETQTAQGEDLASHGYIVAAIDHTFVSTATIFPDHTISAKEATTNFDAAEPAGPITQIMADDASFVIDQLAAINTGQMDSIFKGRLDLEHIGAIGHSVGGAVAYNLAINDPRVKAAIDLDGTVYVTPKTDSRPMASFLMLANDRYHVEAIQAGETLLKPLDTLPTEDQQVLLSIYGSEAAYQAAYDKAQTVMQGLDQVLNASGNLYTITGSDHMKFTDIGLFIGDPRLRELIGIGGTGEPIRCLEITEAVTRTFFDEYLKAESQESLPALLKAYPELKQVPIKQ